MNQVPVPSPFSPRTPVNPAPPYFTYPSPHAFPNQNYNPSPVSPLISVSSLPNSPFLLPRSLPPTPPTRPFSAQNQRRTHFSPLPVPLFSPALPLTPATPPVPTVPTHPPTRHHASTPSRTVPFYTKPDFPNLASVPLLSSANDWSKWYAAVLQIIEATGLYDHIVDIPPAGLIVDPTAYPSLPPTLDFSNYTDEELEHYRTWWTLDDIVSFVLVGKLGPTPASLIPPKRDAWGNPQRSARDILRILRVKYGVYDAGSAALVREAVLSRKVIGNDVSSYVDAWRKAVLQVEGSHWDFSPFEKVQRFADGLPRSYEYEALRTLIRDGFNTHPPHGIISFHDAAQSALNTELAIRRLAAAHPSTSRRSQTTSNSAITPSQPATASTPAEPPTSSSTATRPRCSNCGALGHVAGNCWEPGGGDVGGRDRYLAANPPRARAHVAITSDTTLDPIVETVEPAEIESATEPISLYPDPTANLLPESSPSALYSDFTDASSPVVLSSIADRFNAILDSGCTVHIIRDRHLFWTYDTALATPVGTANCGILTTLARGEVRFKLSIDDTEQVFCLTDCLHAPDAPINLLSVGSMTEKDVRLVFEKNVTSIHFPESLPHLADLSINATVVRRLSFLHLDFVLPPSVHDDSDLGDLIALPAIVRQDSDLQYLHPLAPHSPILADTTVPPIPPPLDIPPPAAPRRSTRTMIPTLHGIDHAKIIRDRDERLVRLRAARAARSGVALPEVANAGVVHPQQSLASIQDFIALLSAQVPRCLSRPSQTS
ncbi:hypothetical protein D9615_006455 [Tricholomella constricta]|uniref:CCHC-type domain-containing protein n=1 Tax=Tricholomella constricta TaxID=117010 RepID=A0A8H5H5Q3_9AGAR|nr:hypothetical protein D9615_006455 [Tricholomella constricta]